MVDQHDLALARARVLLADIAPEIPEDEIVPNAHLTDDLGLDLVSIWALATGLEKMAKVQINDADISGADTLSNLLEHALSDVPLEFQESESFGNSGEPEDEYSEDTSAKEGEESPDADTRDTPEDLQSALEDLADLFNS